MGKKKKNRPSPMEISLPSGGADSHAHLDMEKSGDLEKNLQEARDSGLEHIGQVFLGPQAFKHNHSLFENKEMVFFLLGIHPHEAGEAAPRDREQLTEIFAGDNGIRAVGEIGLDYHYMHSPKETQQKIFAEQLELARQFDLPAVIHCREAEEDALRILKDLDFWDRPLLWHCFGGGPELAAEILEKGWYLSIPGTVTYQKNHPLKEAVARTIPLEKMLVETDAPFLSPEPYRGKPNAPALVVFTALEIAELKGIKAETLWAQTGANCRTFFRLA